MNKYFYTVLIGAILISCNESKDNVRDPDDFHKNSHLNNIVLKYNSVAPVKIKQEDIPLHDLEPLALKLNGVSIKIFYNDYLKKNYFDFSQKSATPDEIKYVSGQFLKSIDNSITDSDLKRIFSMLSTYRFVYYNYYKYKNFEFTLRRGELENSQNVWYQLRIIQSVE